MKSENYQICYDVMVSHMKAVKKNLKRVCTFCHNNVYKIEISLKKYMCDYM